MLFKNRQNSITMLSDIYKARPFPEPMQFSERNFRPCRRPVIALRHPSSLFLCESSLIYDSNIVRELLGELGERLLDSSKPSRTISSNYAKLFRTMRPKGAGEQWPILLPFNYLPRVPTWDLLPTISALRTDIFEVFISGAENNAPYVWSLKGMNSRDLEVKDRGFEVGRGYISRIRIVWGVSLCNTFRPGLVSWQSWGACLLEQILADLNWVLAPFYVLVLMENGLQSRIISNSGETLLWKLNRVVAD